MKRGIIVETNCRNVNVKKNFKDFFSTVSRSLVLNVHADEEGGEEPKDGDEPKNTPTINYEDLISKARKEEKDKQYKTIDKLKGQIETLTKQHNEDLLKIGQLEEDLKTANSKLQTAGQGDSEEIKTLKGTISTLNKEKSDLENKIKDIEDNTVTREELENEIRTELEAEYTTKTYRAEKMAELKDEILVPELVIGNTIEEIDASIEVALEKSKSIREKLGIVDGQPKSPQGRTPKTPSNPSMSRVQDSQFSMEYIAGLDVSSPEYAEFRKQMGLR